MTDGDFLGLLLIAALAVWGGWESKPWWFDTRITRYAQAEACSSSDNSGNRDCTWRNLPLQTYSVNADTQAVFALPQEGNDELERLRNCTVADVENWTCPLELGVTFGFDEGEWFMKGG